MGETVHLHKLMNREGVDSFSACYLWMFTVQRENIRSWALRSQNSPSPAASLSIGHQGVLFISADSEKLGRAIKRMQAWVVN